MPAAAFPLSPMDDPRILDRALLGLVVVGLHVGVIAAVIHFQPQPAPPTPEEQVITVSLTTPARVIQEPEKPVTPQPKTPPPKTPPPPRPRPTPTTTPSTAKPDPVQTLAIPEAVNTPAPVAATVAAPPPAPTPAPAAATAEPSQPIFDAAYLENSVTYPAISKRMGEQGKVMLRVRVSPEGHAETVDLLTSSGFPRLDKAAVDAVRKWRFVPAKLGSQTVAATVKVPVNFTLND
ncbi:energy transducer TonB [Niveibacterium sp. SC-1]|uniref:energy transducer TonB n=1 Tax=Niveibacterium sp. SC-1 TaxID=3135646 RepID=UPI00311D90D8